MLRSKCPRAEGHPTNIQMRWGSGSCLLWGGLDKSLYIVPPPCLSCAMLLERSVEGSSTRPIVLLKLQFHHHTLSSNCLSSQTTWICKSNRMLIFNCIYTISYNLQFELNMYTRFGFIFIIHIYYRPLGDFLFFFTFVHFNGSCRGESATW